MPTLPSKKSKTADKVSGELTSTSGVISHVTVEKSLTKNLGNYNSARVSISVTLPVNFEPKMLEDAMKDIATITTELDHRLEAEITELL